MSYHILFVVPKRIDLDNIIISLKNSKFVIHIANESNKAHLIASKNKINIAFISSDLQDKNFCELLRFLIFNNPEVYSVLLLPSEAYLEKLKMDVKDIRKLRFSGVLYEPLNLEKIKNFFSTLNYPENITNMPQYFEKNFDILDIPDDKLSAIQIENILIDDKSYLDLFIRKERNKYIKYILKDETIEKEKIQKISKENIYYLYFLSKERLEYIQYLNSFISKNQEKLDKIAKIRIINNTSEFFIQEIYTKGITDNSLKESFHICNNIYQSILNIDELSQILKDLKKFNPATYDHLFLVSFFSSIISLSLNWSSKSTSHKITMGGLLHDIGKVKFPKKISLSKFSELNKEEIALYKEHPVEGARLLAKHSSIPEVIQQIVFQHHEKVDGSGFPEGKSGIKIYPLAKVISIANDFSHILVDNNLSFLDGIKYLITDRAFHEKHDADVIKALVNSVSKKKVT